MSNHSTSGKVYYGNIDQWSEGYMAISEQGLLQITPNGPDGPSIALAEVVRQIKQQRDGRLPALLRWPQILQHRAHSITQAYQQACVSQNYPISLFPLYPIKVNQAWPVIQNLLQSGLAGLEVGSKAELLLAVASLQPGQWLVVNGFKDQQMMALACQAIWLGIHVVLVLEKESELDDLLPLFSAGLPKPILGVRVRLASVAQGHWQNSGGLKSKFGLSPIQLTRLITRLTQENLLSCVKVLHFHIGSQLADLAACQASLQEGLQFWHALCQMSVPLTHLDIGGGLAIDYIGMKSNHEFSRDHAITDFAMQVVSMMRKMIPIEQQPVLMTEAGRALTAHHAMLCTEIIDREPLMGSNYSIDKQTTASLSSAHRQLFDLLEHDFNDPLRALEKIKEIHRDGINAFCRGEIELAERTAIEVTCLDHLMALRDLPIAKTVSMALDELVAEKWLCNFSLFRSIPDAWSLGQVFPILPLIDLDQPVAHKGQLYDMTCDSDGHIQHYVTNDGLSPILGLPRYRFHENQWLAIFLVGAYQEILGDEHNLFGAVDVWQCRLSHDGVFELQQEQLGESAADVLQHMHVSKEKIWQAWMDKAERLPSHQLLPLQQQFEQAFSAYSYVVVHDSCQMSKD